MEDIQKNETILQSRPDEIQHKVVKTKAKHPGGRPTVMTPEVIAKLEQAFAIDATVEEALSYAEIKRDAFYDYLKRNKEFGDRIADLRNRPILKARQTIVKGLDESKNAQWYLERKRKVEFAERQEFTGKEGGAIVFMPNEVVKKYKLDEPPSSPEPNSQ